MTRPPSSWKEPQVNVACPQELFQPGSHAPDGGEGSHYPLALTPPAIVPLQWKLGAALDRLRFKDCVDHRRTTTMATSTSRPYPPTRPEQSSPLSGEDAARTCGAQSPDGTRSLTPRHAGLAELKMQLGLHDNADRAGTSVSAEPFLCASTPGTDSEGEYIMNKTTNDIHRRPGASSHSPRSPMG